ncbi:hypothetical protein ABZ235_19490 [Streptomyces canus]|uniref:hypothetical protein n=1 Tax=Streptomyces canus TaxID=58343 RepID=UPI0033AC5D3A
MFGRLFRAHLETWGAGLSDAATAAEPGTPAVAEPDARGRAVFSFRAQNTADRQWSPRSWNGGPVRDALCTPAPRPRSGNPAGAVVAGSRRRPHLTRPSASTPMSGRCSSVRGLPGRGRVAAVDGE